MRAVAAAAGRRRADVLLVAPHADDEALGAGGTVFRHVLAGDRVWVLFVADRVYGHVRREAEVARERAAAEAARRVLGVTAHAFLGFPDERCASAIGEIADAIRAKLREIPPDLVYLPWRGDLHQDHAAVATAALVALRDAPTVAAVYGYEVPGATDPLAASPSTAFLPARYVLLSGLDLEAKRRAVGAYATEARPTRGAGAIEALAARRGYEAGAPYAEAFAVYREVWR